ncbi:MAG TPA: GNAT family N-acetyltransferase [Kaistia sp.]|nr:GNAT family N-acetyltransferase [Kaistia sp.]
MRTETERLILRDWRETDLDAFAQINADPEVMRFFTATRTREETAALMERTSALLAERNMSFLAVEEKASGDFVGMVGLAPVEAPMPCAPTVEIGWRLAKHHWGKGFASEAAGAWLAHGFETLALPEIVAFTFVGNTPSRRVMERLGMTRDPADDFDHPSIAAGHPLRPHVLYRLKAAAFRA